MEVHLVDGTYELFRHYYAVPSRTNGAGEEVGAVRGVVGSVLGMLEDGATHVAVATDHVIESFRNDLYDGYKTGDGIEPALKSQFGPLEESLAALGVTVWPMIEFEADDALAAGARLAAADDRVTRVFICTPDKDMAQCVEGERVVQLDRRKRATLDAAAVEAKYGVPPASIPDWLALVGDAADGFPGLPGWGAKSSAVVLRAYGQIERIPPDHRTWSVQVRSAQRLAATLVAERAAAELYRTLAVLRVDAPIAANVDELRWTGPSDALLEVADRLDFPGVLSRAQRLAEERRDQDG